MKQKLAQLNIVTYQLYLLSCLQKNEKKDEAKEDGCIAFPVPIPPMTSLVADPKFITWALSRRKNREWKRFN